MSEFSRERDKAFIEFVKNGNIEPFRAYAKKYNIPTAPNERIQAAAIYKAVQYCTNISDEVKRLASEKCVTLGFTPYIGGKR